MEEIPRDPMLEFRMSVAGPAVSGVLGLLLIASYYQAAFFLGDSHPLPVLLWTLGVMNVILMAFNLLPAFPMDGGRVLRAYFATKMPYISATKSAAGIGKMFAVLLGILGLFTLSIFTMFIAFFVYIGASEEERSTEISVSLEGIRVKDIMSTNLHTVEPGMRLDELSKLIFHEKHRGYPVVENGRLIGIVTIADLQAVPDERREGTLIGDVMTRKIYVIGPDEEAAVAMRKMTAQGVRRLPVLDEDSLIGIISREDLVRAIELSTMR